MKVSVGADHAGFELKEKLKEHLVRCGLEVQDFGTFSGASVDYPDFARQVGEAVISGESAWGLLVCGTGIGMSIAANKVPGVRAAHVTSQMEAQMAREHNDANVLALGARVLAPECAAQILDTWISTTFAGGRHQRRIDKITEIEKEELKRLV